MMKALLNLLHGDREERGSKQEFKSTLY